ncbi:hypothetical protein DsansV1_C15g0132491 [Dioscorea sansibarensis]
MDIDVLCAFGGLVQTLEIEVVLVVVVVVVVKGGCFMASDESFRTRLHALVFSFLLIVSMLSFLHSREHLKLSMQASFSSSRRFLSSSSSSSSSSSRNQTMKKSTTTTTTTTTQRTSSSGFKFEENKHEVPSGPNPVSNKKKEDKRRERQCELSLEVGRGRGSNLKDIIYFLFSAVRSEKQWLHVLI